MRVLSVTAQKPCSTGSGVYLTEVVRSLAKMGVSQAVVAGVTREDRVDMPEGVTVYPVYFSSEKLPYPVVGMSDEMPYTSTRYRDMTEEMAGQFKAAFLEVLDEAIEKENLQVFVQFDPVWAKHHYGNETTKDTDTNNFCTSGCGIFATVNAIYSLSGHFPDPYELAHYASDKHYRIEDCGTDSGFFKAAAEKFCYK